MLTVGVRWLCGEGFGRGWGVMMGDGWEEKEEEGGNKLGRY